MKRVGKDLGLAMAACLGRRGRQAGEAQDRPDPDPVSGPSAVLGQQARDGFQLAVKDLGGKLGGREVEVIVVDDELKPDVAVTKVKGLDRARQGRFRGRPDLLQRRGQAIHKPIVERHLPHQPECRPLEPRRQGLHPIFFVTSYQNDQIHEVLGKVAQDRGYKRVYLLAPELPGRQGRARRLQAPLQGRDRRGILRSAEQSRLPVRARQDRLPQARRDLHLHAGRHGREPREAVPRRPASRTASRSCPPSRSTNRPCRRSRTPASACSAA